MRIAYRVGWLVGKVVAWVRSILEDLREGFGDACEPVPEYEPGSLAAQLEAVLSLERSGRRSAQAAHNVASAFVETALEQWVAADKTEADEPPACPVEPKTGSRDAKQRQAIYERDRGICQICHKPIGSDKWEIDHAEPLSRGGDDTPDNWQLSHRGCNRRKWAH